ncbi:hypothetical protein LRS74_30720 [Streptomyces sp. LX-29]|uniref:hypothetical protein n=1 Tax=Streptomyces sp. LX-29 TaxID=2900152 RepID=UPI00240D2B33|nr:hypothetical protein [Streptomyces sp. LX-29]WFB10930.1 hypothetical protein LRS74_30720 [Streptomyces sp. LX-29]
MTPPPRHPVLAVTALCCAFLLSGCGGTGNAAESDRESPARPQSLRNIADAIGCTARINVEAEELTQGGCTTERGTYRMVTFAADSGQRAWLTESEAYGGKYLIGKRWVVVAQSLESLDELRGKIGGTIEAAAGHNGMASH